MIERLRTTVGWLALGLLTGSCSADFGSLSEGGQTGSLLPPSCERAAANTFVVPEGRTALLEGHHELNNPTLRDAAGNVIATTLTRHEGALLIRTSGTLPAGDYTLTYECGEVTTLVERDIHVVQAAPLPSGFGELEVVQVDPTERCEHVEFISLRWTPPPEFLPYLGLTRLTLSIDGGEQGTLDFAAPLAADSAGTVLVHIPNCRRYTNVCGFTRGDYVVRAHIADQPESLVSPAVSVNVPCQTDEASGCSLAPSRRSESAWLYWLGLFPLGAMRRRRVRRVR